MRAYGSLDGVWHAADGRVDGLERADGEARAARRRAGSACGSGGHGSNTYYMHICTQASTVFFAYVASLITRDVAAGDTYIHEAAAGHAAADDSAADGRCSNAASCAIAGRVYLCALTIYRPYVLKLRGYG